MFRYADRIDVLLMAVGTVGAMANGLAEPLISVLFGNVINSFGESTNSTILSSVTKVVLDFVYLGIGTAVASFPQVSCWTMAGERQSARIRSFYLKSVLRQDIAFFDTEMTTGEAVSRMSSDTVIIQDALGEKAGKLVQLTSAFFGGFIIALTRGWLLTLVMLTSLPLVAVAGAVSAQMLTRASSKRLISYSDAANTVEQTIGSIRTVVSFNGEKKAIAAYNNYIKKAYKTVIEEGLINGFGMGSVFCILFSSYGLAFWYGGKLIIDKGYTGGKIITVLFAVLTGVISAQEKFTTMQGKLDGSVARPIPLSVDGAMVLFTRDLFGSSPLLNCGLPEQTDLQHIFSEWLKPSSTRSDICGGESVEWRDSEQALDLPPNQLPPSVRISSEAKQKQL